MSILDGNKDNIFGERLKNLRTLIMKKTQKEFSEFIGIPQPTLSAYESGRNKPTVDAVISIADKCNVSIDWLCGRDGTPHLSSLGDIMACLFEIYETKEFSCTTVVHDRVDIENGTETNDEDRNWIQMKFYHCENKRNPEYTYSQSICAMIKKVYELNNRLVNYDYPQDYYNSEKKRLIDFYKEFPISKIDFSGVSEEDRLRIRNEIMRAQWEKQK
ncbi:helix-turn-helix domain-containing protein [Frisingicoccus sp.]